MKLHELIALVKGKKVRIARGLTDVHHNWKDSKINGIIRTYESLDDEGTQYPSESKHVQLKVLDVINLLIPKLADYYDVIASQEQTNQNARADVVVDGKSIMTDVPVTVLMFLDKQLKDLRTLVSNLPTLPTEKKWEYSSSTSVYVTKPVKSFKNRKVYKTLEKSPATKEHPAQVEVYTEDVPEGTWSTTHLSGAITPARKQGMLIRIEKLVDAVKVAREKANAIDVKKAEIGVSLLDYIFNPILEF